MIRSGLKRGKDKKCDAKNCLQNKSHYEKIIFIFALKKYRLNKHIILSMMDIQILITTANEVNSKLGLLPAINTNSKNEEIKAGLTAVAQMLYLHHANFTAETMKVLKALRR